MVDQQNRENLIKQNAAVIGLQWGDEGKGKIVDFLSSSFDAVVRFNGGNNAGHTVIIANNIFKLRILPSGILRAGVISVIGNGVVLDLECLLEEINILKQRGIKISWENLLISENCHLILPYHKELDILYEKNYNIGTTKCGIGPCYEDKVARRGIRLGDLLDENYFSQRLKKAIFHHNTIRKGFNITSIIYEEIFTKILALKASLKQYIFSNLEIEQKLEAKKLLFEGAQGMLLDIDHGTYPFVTSSSASIGQASNGSGLPMPKETIGIIKAYSTRVGEGEFLTELKNAEGELLQNLGKEFGTVSNRARRCGWLDLVLVKRMASITSASYLALTKLDVLDSFETIKICTSYQKNNNNSNNYRNSNNSNGNNDINNNINNIEQEQRLASTTNFTQGLKPVYVEVNGWQTSTYQKTHWDELPKQAKYFIKLIEEKLQLPIKIISTGPERENIILQY